MNLITAIILGIVEGFTEFLPISSTGHLMLTAQLLKIPQSEFVKTFEIAIQLGAIGSVIFLYGKSLVLNRRVLSRIAVAFIPTAIIGFVFYKIIKQFLLSDVRVVLWSLLLGGIFLVVFELWYREKDKAVGDLSAVSYRQAFLIGAFQAISIVPGVSRAAATIIAGLLLGLKRKTIVEFSFLLACPTMAAAAGYDLLKTMPAASPNEYMVLFAGFITAFLVALAAIKFFLSFIKSHTFIPFGIYRIVLALLLLLGMNND